MKTKKILIAVVALVLIGAAVFLHIFTNRDITYSYKDKDFSGMVTLTDDNFLSTVLSVEFKEEAPDEQDVIDAIASALAGQVEKEVDEDGEETDDYVQSTDVPVAGYDTVFINYYGVYTGEDGKLVYFVEGSNMNYDKPASFQIGTSSAAVFADLLLGKKPGDSTYKVLAKGEGEDKLVVPETGVVYVTYKAEYTLGDEKKTESGNYIRIELDPENKHKFYDNIVGKEMTKSTSFTLTETRGEGEDAQEVEVTYTLTPNWGVDPESTFLELEYTYPEDSDATGIDGEELKGKTVTFYVDIQYTYDVPNLDDVVEVPVKDEDGKDTDEKEEQLLVIGKLGFEPEHTEEEWLALDENAGKTHEDYVAYVLDAYKTDVKDGLQEEWELERKYAACKELWDYIVEKSAVFCPEDAIKVTVKTLRDNYEATYYGDYDKYHATYPTFNLYLSGNVYKDSSNLTVEENLRQEAIEVVKEKILIYRLAQIFDITASDEDIENAMDISSEFTMVRYYAYMYYSYGYTNIVEEAVLFDKVMQHLYDEISDNITWTTGEEETT